jgi:hypothetical protein
VVAAPSSCLSFTAEFLGDSFDVATDFSVLKNEPRRLSDFPGHFFWSGEGRRLVLRGFVVREARGGSFVVTKPKRDILVAV